VFIFLRSLSRNVPPLKFNVLKIVPPPKKKIMWEKFTPPPTIISLRAQFYVFKMCFILNIAVFWIEIYGLNNQEHHLLNV
jgi:hypothetical protein